MKITKSRSLVGLLLMSLVCAAYATPDIGTPSDTQIPNTGTTKSINLPSCPPGDMLVTFYAGANMTLTEPSGWTLLFQSDSSYGSGYPGVNGAIAYKLSDGAEGATADWTQTTSAPGVATTVCVDDVAYVALECTDARDFTVSDPDAPSHTPSWGAANNTRYVWFLAYDQDGSSVTISAYPSGYADDQKNLEHTSNERALGIASLSSTATSSDPAVATLSGAEASMLATCSLRPGIAPWTRQVLRRRA